MTKKEIQAELGIAYKKLSDNVIRIDLNKGQIELVTEYKKVSQ